MMQALHDEEQLPEFDKLWDYANPAATEQKFREVLRLTEHSGDISYRGQLLTQIARTEGLQRKFNQSHATLDRVEGILTPDLTLAKSRYLLERGRVFNSSGKPETAMPLFVDAFEVASINGHARYAVDAIHMIAIAERDPAKQVEWNLKGIALVEGDPTQAGWLHALYNNIGESYAALSDYQNAYSYFHKLSQLQKATRGEADMYTVKDEARMLRLLGRPEQSLELMEPIARKHAMSGARDGWVEEELAEALEALRRHEEALPHFKSAHELLQDDDWVIHNDPTKLIRLKKMAQAE
jgi:tetratricopeptide (TPR) repeat protein